MPSTVWIRSCKEISPDLTRRSEGIGSLLEPGICRSSVLGVCLRRADQWPCAHSIYWRTASQEWQSRSTELLRGGTGPRAGHGDCAIVISFYPARCDI